MVVKRRRHTSDTASARDESESSSSLRCRSPLFDESFSDDAPAACGSPGESSVPSLSVASWNTEEEDWSDDGGGGGGGGDDGYNDEDESAEVAERRRPTTHHHHLSLPSDTAAPPGAPLCGGDGCLHCCSPGLLEQQHPTTTTGAGRRRIGHSCCPKSSSRPAWLRAVTVLSCLAAGASYVQSRLKADEYRAEADYWNGAAEAGRDALSTRRFETTSRERDVAELERRNRALMEEGRGPLLNYNESTTTVGGPAVDEESDDASRAAAKRLAELEQDVRDMSRRAALERFGEGPHYVRFELDFPPSEGDGGAAGGTSSSSDETSSNTDGAAFSSSFLVELAPLRLMPHSVHLFLEQVSHQLWDGCAFHVRASHLVMAGPAPSSSSSGVSAAQTQTTAVPTYAARRRHRDKIRSFHDAGLTGVSFPEYSPRYPHARHTLGFVGHPDAGPGFYVNTRDNAAAHADSGDPCFGAVIDGAGTIERLSQMETVEDGGGIVARRPVRIVSAVIVSGPVPGR